jgi:signal transduction histidine kinase
MIPHRSVPEGALYCYRSDMSALATFILANMEDIMREWQKFAATVHSAKGMDRKALRDDAEWILRTIARDMQTPQSRAEQEAKSKDTRPPRKNSAETAAEAHGAQRFVSGFDLNEMVSEYRALRASVIRLWTASCKIDEVQLVEELTRFNEGIDQALSESIRYFAGQLDRSRELFMGILGHDLRTPLHVIQASAERLLRAHANAEQQRQLGVYVRDGANQITLMLADLLDTVRTQLGGSLPLQLREMDIGEVCKVVTEQFRVLHPQRDVQCNANAGLRGRWDEIRVHQLLTNLLRNAIQYGNGDSTITVSALLNNQSVVVAVHNEGEPIPPELMVNIFEPLRRGDAQHRGAQSRGMDSFSMGLGLYIAATIAQAHQGSLTVESTREQGTTFTATLPLVPAD